MKRVYVKTKVRLGIVEEIFEDNSFKYVVFYSNEGNCLVEDGRFIGVLTGDRIEGWYDEKMFRVILENNTYEFILKSSYSKEDFGISKFQITEEIVGEVEIDFFEIPSEITVLCGKESNICMIIDFISLENNTANQEKINEELREAGLM